MSTVSKQIDNLCQKLREGEKPGEGLVQLGLNLVSGKLGPEAAVHSHRVFSEAAESYGSPEAMYELGMCYRWGDGGVYADPEAAVSWLKKAAGKGHQKAKSLLKQFDSPQGKSVLLLSAMSSAKSQGAYWFRSKVGVDYYYSQARSGNAECQYELARQLANPNHYGPFCYNIQEALTWYEKAADQGVVDAMFNLGQLYRLGSQGLEPDPEMARHWFTRCADAGDREARELLKRL